MKDNDKRILSFLKKYRILLWLVTASLALAVTGTLAAYKYQQYAKLVSKIDSSEGLRFSSNYLNQEDVSADITDSMYTSKAKYIYYNSESSGALSVRFNVCNYPQSNPTSYNQYDITYSLYAEAVIKSGDSSLDITDKCKLDDTQITTNGSLIYNEKTLKTEESSCSHTYKITVDKDIADRVEIIIKVIPDDSSLAAVENKMLCRKFIFTQSVDTTSWTGKFLETDDSTDYWAYNYLMTGTKYTKVKLMWNEKYITLSEWTYSEERQDVSQEEISDYGLDSDGTWKEIEFQAGEDGATSYQFQFYRTSENESTGKADSAWIKLVETEDEDKSESEEPEKSEASDREETD